MSDRLCVVAGIDLGGTKCLGVLATPDGRQIADRRVSVADAGDAEGALAQVVHGLLEDARASDATIVGFGIGVPAVIDPQTGRAGRAPHTGWDGFDVAAILSDLPAPWWVDNDVNLAALGEGAVGQARGVADYAVVAIGTGLGGAIVSGGRLLRGRHGAAGELGELPDVGGNWATQLEQTLSGTALTSRVAAVVSRTPATADVFGVAPDARSLVLAALAGDDQARDLLAPALDGLAATIRTLAAVVDPALVILDGSVGRGLAAFLPDVVDRVVGVTSAPPNVVVSQLQPSATAQGAIQLAIKHLGAPTTTVEEGAR